MLSIILTMLTLFIIAFLYGVIKSIINGNRDQDDNAENLSSSNKIDPPKDMKVTIGILTLILPLLSGCVLVPMEEAAQFNIEVNETIWPDVPELTITALGNARPQRYYIKYSINGREAYNQLTWLETNCPEKFELSCDFPGEYEIKVKIGLHTGSGPWWIHDQTVTTMISKN